MSWDILKSAAEAIQAIVATIGIVAAGIWTLYNFGLTRVSAPQIEISVQAKTITEVKNKKILTLCLEVRNTGKTRIYKRYAILGILPIRIQENWPSLTRISSQLIYQRVDAHEILVSHTYLDPGEKYHEEFSIDVSGYDFIQAGLVFAGLKRDQAWESNYVFDLSLKQ